MDRVLTIKDLQITLGNMDPSEAIGATGNCR